MLDELLVGATTALALFLAAVAVRAWRHDRGGRVALLAGAFLVMLAKGLLFTWGVLTRASWRHLALPGLGLDAAALLLLYVAVLRPSPRPGSR